MRVWESGENSMKIVDFFAPKPLKITFYGGIIIYYI